MVLDITPELLHVTVDGQIVGAMHCPKPMQQPRHRWRWCTPSLLILNA
jgi:hypothetical protein